MVYYILWGAWNECATAEGMKKKRKKSVRWATMRRWWTLYDQSREWISRQASSWHSMSIDYSAENKSTLWAVDIVAIKWAIFQGLCARDLLVRVALAAVTVSSTSVLTTMTLDDDDDYCSVITADIHSSTLFLHLKLAVFLLFYFRFDTPFLDNAHCAIHSHVSLSLSLALLFFIVLRESFFFQFSRRVMSLAHLLWVQCMQWAKMHQAHSATKKEKNCAPKEMERNWKYKK